MLEDVFFKYIAFIRLKLILKLSHNNCADRFVKSDESIGFLPYQFWMAVYWTAMTLTGNGELGFDTGEGALEMATTSKEGSRRVNYPILILGR